MAQSDLAAAVSASFPSPDTNSQMQQNLWRRLFSGRERDNRGDALSGSTANGQQQWPEQQNDHKAGLARRVSRKVVPGLPRTQTFKRQCSEVRSRLEPVRPTPAERRAVSVDRRVNAYNNALNHPDPRTSAPDFLHHCLSAASSPPLLPMNPLEGMLASTEDPGDFDDLDRVSCFDGPLHDADALSRVDVASMTTSQYEALIDSELERKWILNLSMHFRDKSKREKFFVTYRQHEHLWRRVTISVDYRDAPENSLEAELSRAQYQRDKSAKIYEAIRDSLPEIDFYNSVTNLKLETKDGRLHVHVVEDVNEIIIYPPVRMVRHMNCRLVKQREIHFDAHMSGFVYKVRVHGKLLIKKEIPGPESVDEFLYEINALNQLRDAKNVIRFYGVVVDDREEHVTGLLIDYAARGALIDVIYDNERSLPWPIREKWARQIVGGLSEIHEAGFVQGDFTLSNIVIDENDDAKIIDINRRGCPIGWEPPEATALIETNQRISMYIGVKSDLYQLGMVLWALATQEDEPEAFARPLKIDPDVQVPPWYRRVVDTCLSADPRNRVQALQLLTWFPEPEGDTQRGRPNGFANSVNGEGTSRRDYLSPSGIPQIKTVHPPTDWSYVGWGNSQLAEDSFYYPSRGRSPPSPMPSNQGDYDPARYGRRTYTWSDSYNHVPIVPSVSDVLSRAPTEGPGTRLRGSEGTLETYADGPRWLRNVPTGTNRADGSLMDRGRSPRLERAGYAGDGEQEKDGEVGREPVSVRTWGPPSEHWQLMEQRRDLEDDDDNDDKTDGDGASWGKTGPESRADSGKDVTEVAGTPSERRRYFTGQAKRRTAASREDGSRASAKSTPRRSGQLISVAPTNTTTGGLAGDHHPHGGDTNSDSPDQHGHERNDEDAASRPRPPPSPEANKPALLRRSDDDLKGIGAAYDAGGDAHHENRRDGDGDALDLEDDLDLDLDKGLAETIAADATKVKPPVRI
ncbi:7c61546a-48a8-419c-95e4-b6add6a16e5a [Thermothielavioides terrestris]|uniref:Protein kinase domain-containing protein n=2 Tax=Thermothielavioides terrestris TaxID=2587410 RepID=G2R5A6_THETT|nr:uncharacterized protein THITE_2115633 [Thermothielavioides terrestris NRRL 8126]AEO66986.1 hypothetical protein THITE_2115633 [Thermothielavioides terrestris NRRL 8126]SPQ23686.1 7c61546a-48a8-419c-95e4-b6add6a16e5a [Thermothielavioides terrestris]